MLVIGTYATKSYLFAWRQFLTRITTAASYKDNVHFVFATDSSKESKEAYELAKTLLPERWKVILINLNIEDEDKEKYKEESQFLIASMQGAAFNYAKKIKAKMFWSVEADTLVPADALRISEWALNMPQANGEPYYDVAACTYFNGSFLGGFGTPNTQLNEDFLPEERKLPERFKKLYEKCQERIENLEKQLKEKVVSKNNDNIDKDIDFLKINTSLEKEGQRFSRLRTKIKKYPPDGNLWEVISKNGWRRRGWFDFAYPGIGKGSVVPSDWCGFGCTLMSEKALLLANFDGYQGKGTQDLFVCWNKWYPADVKIACIPHVVCDHVKHEQTKDTDNAEILENKTKYVHHIGYHETDGSHKNHLRVKHQPWIPI
jgi:hypothetical protein